MTEGRKEGRKMTEGRKEGRTGVQKGRKEENKEGT
jgi:hypothetical protein